jgi:hypothetical protein
MVPLTALEALPAALAEARSWEPDAELLAVHMEEGIGPDVARVDASDVPGTGRPGMWFFEFQGPGGILFLDVGASGIAGSMVMPRDMTDVVTPISLAAWTVDSDHAVRAAREAMNSSAEGYGDAVTCAEAVQYRLEFDAREGRPTWTVRWLGEPFGDFRPWIEEMVHADTGGAPSGPESGLEGPWATSTFQGELGPDRRAAIHPAEARVFLALRIQEDPISDPPGQVDATVRTQDGRTLEPDLSGGQGTDRWQEYNLPASGVFTVHLVAAGGFAGSYTVEAGTPGRGAESARPCWESTGRA